MISMNTKKTIGYEEETGEYVFHREDGFYPLQCDDDADAVANALANPGTLKVTSAATGRVIWQAA